MPFVQLQIMVWSAGGSNAALYSQNTPPVLLAAPATQAVPHAGGKAASGMAGGLPSV
jgi:hypothetical protein